MSFVPVLLLLSCLHTFLRTPAGALAVKDLEKSRPAIHNLLKKYRAGNGYVAHIRHEVPEGTPVFTPDTKLAKEFSELEEGMDEHKDTETVIGKKFPGSFAETELDKFVEKSQKKKLVLCGYMAHVGPARLHGTTALP